MTLELFEILNCVSGKLVLEGTDHKFNKIVIDTRKINDEEIFLAISGKNFDGNKYVEDAFNKGIKLCIVSSLDFDKSYFIGKNLSVILVDNTIKALEQLAIYVRQKLSIDLVGVTGSVGKTTTKDIIYDFLSTQYRTYKVKGNFNNHLGLPISLINIDDDAEIGVFELGMSGLGEIDYLARILKPKIAVITNIGTNHIEFLGSKENILRAKLEIVNYFDSDSILILNSEDELLKTIRDFDFNIYRVGFSECCDNYAFDIELCDKKIDFNTYYNSKERHVSINLIGKHNILNSLIAFKICEIFNVEFKNIESKFRNLTISSMRQEIIKHNEMTIINDCYNAGVQSIKSSVDVLFLHKGKKVAILGDMLELGDYSEECHKEVSRYLNGKIDILIAVGKFREFYGCSFLDKQNFYSFENIEGFDVGVLEILDGNETILIKASRSANFERISEIIKKKF